LDGAIDGIRAVEKKSRAWQDPVYPSCHGLKVTPLSELGSRLPLANGQWSNKPKKPSSKEH